LRRGRLSGIIYLILRIHPGCDRGYWTSKPPALEEMKYSLTPDVTEDIGLQSLRLWKK